MNAIEADVLILGAGVAGLVTALNAAPRRVTLVAATSPDRSPGTSSELAQGGIAAAVRAGDSPSLHLEDTVRAGAGLVQIGAARYLCERAASAVAYLNSLGVPFDREADAWSLHTEAAHSRARVFHVGDATGAAIMRALRTAVKAAPHIELLEDARAVQLLTNGGEVCGVLAAGAGDAALTVHAREVVIATGGIGALYARTTNPMTASGDGLAIAIAAGARSAGLEFVQFHPTALNVDAARLPLLTEALRGAGATLVDERGERILEVVHPRAELAPRDVVARTVYTSIERGSRVFLDATRIENCDLASAFPTAYRVCLEHGYELRREPIPITPAAHYHMGGIAADLNARTSLPGLWAVGEAACTGAHGANRLASNSLLEAVVFGRRCGRALASERLRAPLRGATGAEVGFETGHGVHRALREMMWHCMGVARNAHTISEGLTYVARARERLSPDHTLERSRLLLVEHMLMAAARRTTNVGAHYRSDVRRSAQFDQACA